MIIKTPSELLEMYLLHVMIYWTSIIHAWRHRCFILAHQFSTIHILDAAWNFLIRTEWFSNDALELIESGVEGERDISTRAHMHCHTPLLFAWRKSCVGNITEIYFYHALTASHCRIHTRTHTLFVYLVLTLTHHPGSVYATEWKL